MKTQPRAEIAGQVILIFVLAAALYFGAGAFNFPITETIRE